MTTQKYKSLLVIIWALWAFHPCLAIDDVLRTAKRDAILAQITGAVRPKKQISLISFGAKGDGKKDCKPAFDKAMKRAAHMGGAHIVVPAGEYLLNGPIHFVSNVCLELQEGATLKFSSEPSFLSPSGENQLGRNFPSELQSFYLWISVGKCFHHRQRSDRWKCGDYFCHLEK